MTWKTVAEMSSTEVVSDAAASLQESRTKKAAWLTDVQGSLPIGTRVRVVASDNEDYVGLTGTVASYDVGHRGDWPLVMVRLDDGRIDGFYDDTELVTRGLWKEVNPKGKEA
jgi:hypothetical protein